MEKILVFIIGAVIGSFLNVCIYRLPKKKSIAFPPSHCPKCNENILWFDNIPIVSYLILAGKCRFCKANIPFRYFLVEILTAIVTLLLFIAFGMDIKLFAYSIMAYGLIIATFVDFEIQEIPDQVSLGLLAAGLISAFAFPSLLDAGSRLSGLWGSFLGAVAGAASIYLMGFFGELVFKKEAMGGGDIKLMAMIGSFLGWKLAVLTFFVAPFFGAAVGLILRMKDGRQIIPYGPYLSLAAIVAVFFGNRILSLLFYGMGG